MLRSKVRIFPIPPLKWIIGFWWGPSSSDRDRSEHSPVGLSGVEQDSDAVVLEVPKAESNPLDALDQVVDGLRWGIGDSLQMVVADLVEPPFEGPPQALDLPWHCLRGRPSDEVIQHGSSRIWVLGSVEVSEALFDPVGNRHLSTWVTELEQ